MAGLDVTRAPSPPTRQATGRPADPSAAVEVFDRHAADYSAEIDRTLGSYGARHAFFTEHKARLILRLLAARGRDPGAMRLLDVGCGVGQVHAHLGPRFAAIEGVDVSAASIEVARATYPQHRYHVYDGGRLPVADASADLSLAICVFHHVPPEGWAGLAAEMLRVLRPGGLALVIEHNPFNPLTRKIVRDCPLDRDAVLLRPATLRELFRDAGAARVTSRSMLSVPPVNGALMTLDGWFGRLPFGAQYWCLAECGAGHAGA